MFEIFNSLIKTKLIYYYSLKLTLIIIELLLLIFILIKNHLSIKKIIILFLIFITSLF